MSSAQRKGRGGRGPFAGTSTEAPRHRVLSAPIANRAGGQHLRGAALYLCRDDQCVPPGRECVAFLSMPDDAEPDPVIEAYERNVDLTLIGENLRRAFPSNGLASRHHF